MTEIYPMDFKGALEWILKDWDTSTPTSIHRELNELIYCVEVDDVLYHEDIWEKYHPGEAKPECDIELCGEHFFIDWQ